MIKFIADYSMKWELREVGALLAPLQILSLIGFVDFR